MPCNGPAGGPVRACPACCHALADCCKDGAGRRKRGDDVHAVSAADFRAQLIYVQRYNILSLRPNVWAFLGAQRPKGPRRRHHQRRGAQARHGGGLTAHRQSRRPRFVKFSPNARQAAQLPGGQRIAKQGILPRKTARYGLQYRPFGLRERAAARGRQAAVGARGAACTVFSQAQPWRQAGRQDTLQQNILPLRPFSLSLHRRLARAESPPANIPDN